MDTLISSKTCPFAHRVEIVIKLSQKDIDIVHTNPIFGADGWVFLEPYNNMLTLKEVYKTYRPDQERNFSVPLFITNNEPMSESLDICKLLMPSLFRHDISSELDDFNARFSKAHYMAGHTKDIEVYRTNYKLVFNYLDDLDQKLIGKYILGDDMSILDIVVYTHVCRFDPIYHDLFRLNGKWIKDYPNIQRWLTELSEISAFSETLDIKTAKMGYELCAYHQPDKLSPFNHIDI